MDNKLLQRRKHCTEHFRVKYMYMLNNEQYYNDKFIQNTNKKSHYKNIHLFVQVDHAIQKSTGISL